MRKPVIAAGLITRIALLATNAAWGEKSLGPNEKYDPQVDPAEFTRTITNPYLSKIVGSKLMYEQETEEGKEREEILVPGWTKTILCVETTVSW